MNRIREAFARGLRRVLFVLPTGGGKTFCFVRMTKGARERGRRVLIIVHRQELLSQASGSLSRDDVEHGVIAPGRFGHTSQVAVASIQTLERRLAETPMDFDFLILDEAHHVTAGTWQRVLAHFPKAFVLGVTATPCRTTGEGLGEKSGGIFQEMIQGPSIRELIDMGYLAPPIVYSPPSDLDLTGLRRSKGDFTQKQLAERVQKSSIVGDAVEHYRRLCAGEPAIAFCASIAHAETVRDSFRAAHFTSEVIHGKLDDHTRATMIQGLASGRIQVLTSVDLISEGTDIPVVSVAILLRPTDSLGLYLQQVGRVLRLSPGKTRALILDHVGNWRRHDVPDADREWSLDGEKKKKSTREAVPTVRQCPKCYAPWMTKALSCPECFHVLPTKSRKIEEVDGELEELTKEQIEAARLNRRREVGRAETREELEAIAKARGYSPGWVWNQLKHRKPRRQTSGAR